MHHHLLYLLFFVLPHAIATFAAGLTGGGGGCDRRCGNTIVPYPFGFSAGACPILLMCNATISNHPMLPQSTLASPYPILSFNSTASTFVASVTPTCNRTVRRAEALLTSAKAAAPLAGYGVSSRTGLFLRGGACRAPATGFNCTVPEELMTRILRTTTCRDEGVAGNNSNNTALICVSVLTAALSPAPAPAPAPASGGDGKQGQFVRWETVNKTGCVDALTAVVYGETPLVGVASLQFGVAELGFWLNGTCVGGTHPCAVDATCHDVETPSGGMGHRCVCKDGMTGDGFAAGDGCHSTSAASNKNIAPIVAGVLAGTVAATVVLLLCWLHRRRSAAGRYASAMRLLSEAAASSGVPVYSYHEVARATNGFSHTHRLGTGAYGTVYVGKLPSSSSTSLVAIKRLRHRLAHHHHADAGEVDADAAQLVTEIRLVSSVSHPNLVRLLGCCLDRGEHILVYEYVPNGTLAHHLHHHNSGAATLPWRARLGVAAGTAAAIAHLHATRPPIFHRDVKSSNILLDSDLRPKLADFGLSRSAGVDRVNGSSGLTHVSTAPQGTPGYVDPEYHQSFHLSDKSDVYSFGVVLLELVTAKKVVDFDRPPAEVNLASLGLDRIGKGRVHEIVDPAILSVDRAEEEWVMESVRRVSELAFRCLAFQKDVRPCMSEVAAELVRIRAAAPPGSDESGIGSRSRVELTGLKMDDMSFGSSSDSSSVAKKKAASPVSVHEVWVKDRSSPPSTNGSTVMPRFL